MSEKAAPERTAVIWSRRKPAQADGAHPPQRRDQEGKAGHPPEPETLELYQSHFIEGRPWKTCFEELWSKPERKPPAPHQRQRVMRHLRERVKAYAATRPTPKHITERAA